MVRCHGAENAPDVAAFGLLLREEGLFYLASVTLVSLLDALRSPRTSSNVTSGFARSGDSLDRALMLRGVHCAVHILTAWHPMVSPLQHTL